VCFPFSLFAAALPAVTWSNLPPVPLYSLQSWPLALSLSQRPATGLSLRVQNDIGSIAPALVSLGPVTTQHANYTFVAPYCGPVWQTITLRALQNGSDYKQSVAHA
jgi:hypothetical protein